VARAGGQPGVQRLEGLDVKREGGGSSDRGGGLGRAGTLALLLVAVAVVLGLLEEGEGRKEEGRGREGRMRKRKQHPCAIDWKEGEKGSRKGGGEREDEKSVERGGGEKDG